MHNSNTHNTKVNVPYNKLEFPPLSIKEAATAFRDRVCSIAVVRNVPLEMSDPLRKTIITSGIQLIINIDYYEEKEKMIEFLQQEVSRKLGIDGIQMVKSFSEQLAEFCHLFFEATEHKGQIEIAIRSSFMGENNYSWHVHHPQVDAYLLYTFLAENHSDTGSWFAPTVREEVLYINGRKVFEIPPESKILKTHPESLTLFRTGVVHSSPDYIGKRVLLRIRKCY